MGAGAAQTMINVNRVLPGQKILMVGSGNVGLIVSYQLMQAGADVVAIVEAMPKVSGYGVHAAKVRRAGVPILTGHTVLEAVGHDSVEGVIISQIDDHWQPVSGTEKHFSVDTITIAVGLKPMISLAGMHGCNNLYIPKLGGRVLVHDKNMESTSPGIYVAGDATGIEEANSALEEGRIAGIAVSESLGFLSPHKASDLKEEVWTRLNGLRLGPFGVQRMKAKEEIVHTYDSLVLSETEKH
jgi:thioredoxin reductase